MAAASDHERIQGYFILDDMVDHKLRQEKGNSQLKPSKDHDEKRKRKDLKTRQRERKNHHDMMVQDVASSSSIDHRDPTIKKRDKPNPVSGINSNPSGFRPAGSLVSQGQITNNFSVVKPTSTSSSNCTRKTTESSEPKTLKNEGKSAQALGKEEGGNDHVQVPTSTLSEKRDRNPVKITKNHHASSPAEPSCTLTPTSSSMPPPMINPPVTSQDIIQKQPEETSNRNDQTNVATSSSPPTSTSKEAKRQEALKRLEATKRRKAEEAAAARRQQQKSKNEDVVSQHQQNHAYEQQGKLDKGKGKVLEFESKSERVGVSSGERQGDDDNEEEEIARKLMALQIEEDQRRSVQAVAVGDIEPGLSESFEGDYIPNPLCSNEQLMVLKQIREGYNTFFTGSAGTGKSYLLDEIRRMLSSKRYLKHVAVTAPTGIAADNIHGITLHSWAGIGLGDGTVKDLYFMSQARDRHPAWKEIQVLIIDEISMVNSELFTKLDILSRRIKKDERPFGGIQLVVSGDFFQLPPVPLKNSACIRCGGTSFSKPTGLRYSQDVSQNQQQQQRRPVQASSVRCLGKEVGRKLGCGLEKFLHKYCFETTSWTSCHFKMIELTKVFRQSDEQFISILNKIRIGKCDSEVSSFIFACQRKLIVKDIKPTILYSLNRDVKQDNDKEYDKLDGTSHAYRSKDCGDKHELRPFKNIPEVLNLKVGCQVLLNCNLDLGRGLVNGSRGVVVGFEQSVIQDDFVPLEMRDTPCPKVLFSKGDTLIIKPKQWTISENKMVSRTQIPLQLAWALTVHKSQGQSLDLVQIDLNGVFAPGQSYVALSRARTKNGMEVKNFSPKHIKADPAVAEFYERARTGLDFWENPGPLHSREFFDFKLETTDLSPSLAPGQPARSSEQPEWKTNLHHSVKQFASSNSASNHWPTFLEAVRAEFAGLGIDLPASTSDIFSSNTTEASFHTAES